MDFQTICLKRKELRALETSSKQQIPVNRAPRLLRLKLTQCIYNHVPGGMPIPTDEMIISDRGRDYLAYIKDVIGQRRIENIRYFITTAIALTALIKSFMPEIRAGLALLWNILGQ